jgi:hypothetical protein
VRREEHDVEKARFWRSTIAIPEFPPRTVRTSEIPRPVNTLEKPSPSNSLARPGNLWVTWGTQS